MALFHYKDLSTAKKIQEYYAIIFCDCVFL